MYWSWFERAIGDDRISTACAREIHDEFNSIREALAAKDAEIARLQKKLADLDCVTCPDCGEACHDYITDQTGTHCITCTRRSGEAEIARLKAELEPARKCIEAIEFAGTRLEDDQLDMEEAGAAVGDALNEYYKDLKALVANGGGDVDG